LALLRKPQQGKNTKQLENDKTFHENMIKREGSIA
jgi:hypothetical protein